MQKIHNIIFAIMTLAIGFTFILLMFGNEKLGGYGILISLALIIAEQFAMKKVVKETKKDKIVVENIYTPPSRMGS